MNLSKLSVETLIDLVENKLSCMDVWDREDRREAMMLERCLGELKGLTSAVIENPVIAFDETRRRRGRRPKLSRAV